METNSKTAFYERRSGEIIPDAPSSIARLQLSEAVPLDTPLAVHLFPIYACNLRCEFCIWALNEQRRGYLSDVKVMTYATYCKTIDGLKEFPCKLGLWRIAGVGEPLMHPKIDKFVRYAVNSGSIERVEIVTNATLLTHELSDKLIDAGLAKLRVSIQGNSADTYKKYTKQRINYDALVENLAYYYNQRGNSKLYVKVMSYMLEDENAAEQFIKQFEPICDALQIEHLTPVVNGIDFDELAGGKKLNSRQTGGAFDDVAVCALPFYMLQLNPDGKVFPCCSFRVPQSLGNVHQESIYSIWNGRKLYDFRMKMLAAGAAGMSGICTDCNYFKFIMQQLDILDGHEKIIKQRITNVFYA
jgi:radical SAM protein with 4Fe4S-binding SPASM domain